MAFIPREYKNILVLSINRTIWEFRGSHSGPYLIHYGSVAHPQDWIRPVAVTAAEDGVLLISHLSSFGTFRSSYDASIWPPVGITDILRRNGVFAPHRATPIPRLAETQSASRLFSLCPFAHPCEYRNPSLRISNVNFGLLLELLF